MQDVTTRGEYYPDKSMATAAVSLDHDLVQWSLLTVQEPTSLSPRH